MRIRPLPDTDLGRIAPLSKPLKLAALRQMRDGWAPLTYKPVRLTHPDIFNAQLGLFAFQPPTEWRHVAARIERLARTDEERVANLQVARGLHVFCEQHRVESQRWEFFPFALSIGWQVSYWLRMVHKIDGQPTVLFLDPRRSRGLNTAGRRLVLSLMHERIRVLEPDLATVRLGIVQFGDEVPDKDSPAGHRPVILHLDSGVKLFGYEEADAMIRETFEMWKNVLEERRHEPRPRAGGGGGTLF